jgi:hypothetical protein
VHPLADETPHPGDPAAGPTGRLGGRAAAPGHARVRERYALRAGAESTLSQAVRVGDLRHTRSLGLARTHLQQRIIAVALNVIRTLAWPNEVPRGPTRVSRRVALAAPA